MAPLGKDTRVYKNGRWGIGAFIVILIIVVIHVVLEVIIRAIIQVLQKLDWNRRRHKWVEPTSQEIHRPRIA
jgi:hypothetical protein